MQITSDLFYVKFFSLPKVTNVCHTQLLCLLHANRPVGCKKIVRLKKDVTLGLFTGNIMHNFVRVQLLTIQ